MSRLLKPLFLTLLVTLGVALVSCVIDTGFIYWQATRGRKLPFKLSLVPRLGSD